MFKIVAPAMVVAFARTTVLEDDPAPTPDTFPTEQIANTLAGLVYGVVQANNLPLIKSCYTAFMKVYNDDILQIVRSLQKCDNH